LVYFISAISSDRLVGLTSNTENGLCVSDDHKINGIIRLSGLKVNVGSSVDISQVRFELGAHTVLVGEGLEVSQILASHQFSSQ
jgi:hypothetical protein